MISMKRNFSVAVLMLVALVLGAFVVSAQEKRPDYGTIADLKGLTKVYVNAPSTERRKIILAELKKAPSLTVVNSPDQAEFFLEYRVIDETHPMAMLNFVKAEMAAYTVKDGRKRIAWSETKGETNRADLPRAFVKALKKAQTSP